MLNWSIISNLSSGVLACSLALGAVAATDPTAAPTTTRPVPTREVSLVPERSTGTPATAAPSPTTEDPSRPSPLPVRPQQLTEPTPAPITPAPAKRESALVREPVVQPALQPVIAPVSRPVLTGVPTETVIPPVTNSADALIDRSQWLLLSASVEAATRERALLSSQGLLLRSRSVFRELDMVVSRFVLSPDVTEPPDAVLIRIRTAHPDLILEFNRHYLPLAGATDIPAARLTQALQAPERYGQALVGWTSACHLGNDALSLAMLDGQVNAALPEFSASAIRVFDATAREPEPTHHATAIAALLVGNGPQALLPGAHLLAVTIFAEAADQRLQTQTEWILVGLEQVLRQRPLPMAVNLSFGGPPSELLTQAFARMAQQTILVAAVGNSGPSLAPVFPAQLESVVAVTAIGPDGRLYEHANQGAAVDIAAPGVDIQSINARGQTTFVTGTSFAAPWVTAALARSAHPRPDRPSPERWAALYRQALDLGEPGKDETFGFGLLNVVQGCGR